MATSDEMRAATHQATYLEYSAKMTRDNVIPVVLVIAFPKQRLRKGSSSLTKIQLNRVLTENVELCGPPECSPALALQKSARRK